MEIDVTLYQDHWLLLSLSAKERDDFYTLLEMVKTLPTVHWEKKHKAFKFSIYYFNELENLANNNEIDVYCDDIIFKVVDKYKKRAKRILGNKSKKPPEFNSKYWNDDYKLYEYQKLGVWLSYSSLHYALGDEMGLGKTPQAIAVMCKAFDDEYQKALVLVPNRLRYQWKNEILKFTKLKDEEVVILGRQEYCCPKDVSYKNPHLGRHPCRQCEKLDECRAIKANPNKWRENIISRGKVVIVHYEGVSTIKEYEPLLKKQGFDILISDESTRLKNNQSTVYKKVKRIRDTMDFHSVVLMLSGTFIENRVEEIYGPLSVMDQKIFGTVSSFRDKYLVRDHFNAIIGYKNQDKLKKIIERWMLRRTIDVVWKDRPTLTTINKELVMCDKQREFYEDARDGVLEDIKNGMDKKINMASVATAYNYLLQICGTTAAIEPTLNESVKIEYLIDMLSEEISHNQKVLIFSFFAKKVIPHIQAAIEKKFKGQTLTIVGGSKSKDTQKIMNNFKNNKKSRFLICSDAMAYGANLQCAEYVVNFDLPWNPAILDQRIRRVYRRGQEKPVTVVNLTCSDTVENRVLELINEKRGIFNEFIEFGKTKCKSKKITAKKLLSLFQ